MSLAAVVIMTANVFSNCGLSQYIVSKPNTGRGAAFHATFYFMVLGVVALGIALLVGGPFGTFINAPTLTRFLPGLAVAALLERVGTIKRYTSRSETCASSRSGSNARSVRWSIPSPRWGSPRRVSARGMAAETQ